jgi:hypothetical protein
MKLTLKKPAREEEFTWYEQSSECDNCLRKTLVYIRRGVRRSGLSFTCPCCACKVRMIGEWGWREIVHLLLCLSAVVAGMLLVGWIISLF